MSAFRATTTHEPFSFCLTRMYVHSNLGGSSKNESGVPTPHLFGDRRIQMCASAATRVCLAGWHRLSRRDHAGTVAPLHSNARHGTYHRLRELCVRRIDTVESDPSRPPQPIALCRHQRALTSLVSASDSPTEQKKPAFRCVPISDSRLITV